MPPASEKNSYLLEAYKGKGVLYAILPLRQSAFVPCCQENGEILLVGLVKFVVRRRVQDMVPRIPVGFLLYEFRQPLERPPQGGFLGPEGITWLGRHFQVTFKGSPKENW